MPTKLNSFGKQQPYVPAGNGEASGEYGDYANGSNKHFDSFTKEVNVTKKAQQRTYENLKKNIRRIAIQKSRNILLKGIL